MKTVTLPSGKNVNLPSTGDEWQLYTCSKPCGRAAAALHAAVVRVAKEIDRMASKGYRPSEAGAEKLYRDIVSPVMTKYSSFGASDTEPRGVAYDAIDRIVSVVTGERTRYNF